MIACVPGGGARCVRWNVQGFERNCQLLLRLHASRKWSAEQQDSSNCAISMHGIPYCCQQFHTAWGLQQPCSSLQAHICIYNKHG